ncbi:hypothetical protein Vadar_009596 [Vaccinium darrowii]|uniref:Uncharacterized protein n=1 Tax=Vaccinium darrowii TaxID=229202 RepID=A0ACB7WZD4_9ERIC|nr:hypothetical protein Vadar_009596 [Vaccinium darrowii]
MLILKVLIGNLQSIYQLASGSISNGEVAALAHEPWYHTMKGEALELQRLAALPDAFLSNVECSDVLPGAWSGVNSITLYFTLN